MLGVLASGLSVAVWTAAATTGAGVLDERARSWPVPAFQGCVDQFDRDVAAHDGFRASANLLACTDEAVGDCIGDRSDTPTLANCAQDGAIFIESAVSFYADTLVAAYQEEAEIACGAGSGGASSACARARELADYRISVLNAALSSFSDWADRYGEFCGLAAYPGRESIISQASCKRAIWSDWAERLLGEYAEFERSR